MESQTPEEPEEMRLGFDEFLASAQLGEMPPTETGLPPRTLYALEAVARAAYRRQPIGKLVAAARATFADEMISGG